MANTTGTGTGTKKERKIGPLSLNARFVIPVVLAVLAIWFILMNTAKVKIHLWGIAVVTMPGWVMLAVMLLIGLVIGWFGHGRMSKRSQ